ncbi:MAG: hypothetical protein M1820_001856 [Bogoriella megaspora]|nr:MAG: hypothetical protein M1820_001856 [Bogoriella megaspora]
MSHFTNQKGLSCDNVKSFEAVLADSRVVQASATENPDLFRALKGGGPNFGIVTRFDLYTHPDYRLWYNLRVYSASESDKVFEASIEVQKAMEYDDRIGFFLVVNPSLFVAGILYRGECTSAPKVFHAFDGIEPIQMAIPPTNGTDLSATRVLAMDGEGKREGGTVSVRVDADLYSRLHKTLQEIATSSSFTLQFAIQPVAILGVQKGDECGGNSLKIPPENQSWLAMLVQWTDDANDDEARSQIRQLIESARSVAESSGHLLDFQFMNGASCMQSPLKSYGPERLASLRAASEKWDPDGVFQHLQQSGFLLYKAVKEDPTI